jgi:hypothetical protein
LPYDGQCGTASLPTRRRDRPVATNGSNETPTQTPTMTELVREIPVRDTLLNRIWTIVIETFAHPLTRSVLHLEPLGQVGTEPSK